MSIAETSFRAAATKPSQAVYIAIQDADYATHGAPFDPLLIKFAAVSDFANGWASKDWTRKGAGAMRFYQYPGPDLRRTASARLATSRWLDSPMRHVFPSCWWHHFPAARISSLIRSG